MHVSIRTGFAALASISFVTGVSGQSGEANAETPPACTGSAPSVPVELTGWPSRRVLDAAADRAGLGKARVTIGTAIDAGLHPTPEVHYLLRPEKPGGSVSFGGLYTLTIEQGGTYRIALGSAAWIDMVADGKALDSLAHGHGPDCTDIRKVVDFSLRPGRYVLQISANASKSVPLMVVRLS